MEGKGQGRDSQTTFKYIKKALPVVSNGIRRIHIRNGIRKACNGTAGNGISRNEPRTSRLGQLWRNQSKGRAKCVLLSDEKVTKLS